MEEMKLNELIGNALKELELAKRYDEKRNYLVDEVTLEISVSSVKSVQGGFEFKIFNVGTDTEGSSGKEKAHKITIKLKPKKTAPSNATGKKTSP
jgi:hypothetical protein